NIKGVFQIWMKDGSYHEIDLKECHQWTRTGCKHCPDFAAEHADISTGGIGKDNDWTLTIVRTEIGEEVINRMIKDGVIIARPAQEDEVAMKLLRTLSIVSRRRWPDWADKARSGFRRRRRKPTPRPRQLPPLRRKKAPRRRTRFAACHCILRPSSSPTSLLASATSPSKTTRLKMRVNRARRCRRRQRCRSTR
ncbi:MAG: Coenzyme F420 hydrogenase/dehydrogenase, beta subunit C-terminal domain, partial [Ilumatobacteraceae bacterium]